MSLTLMRYLRDYRWANHLPPVAVALNPPACARELGKQFSVPTLTRMFAHVYGADLNWLKRWNFSPWSESPYFALGSMAEVRRQWAPAGSRAEGLRREPDKWTASPSTTRTRRGGPTTCRSACCCSTWPTTRPITAARSPPC